MSEPEKAVHSLKAIFYKSNLTKPKFSPFCHIAFINIKKLQIQFMRQILIFGPDFRSGLLINSSLHTLVRIVVQTILPVGYVTKFQSGIT